MALKAADLVFEKRRGLYGMRAGSVVSHSISLSSPVPFTAQVSMRFQGRHHSPHAFMRLMIDTCSTTHRENPRGQATTFDHLQPPSTTFNQDLQKRGPKSMLSGCNRIFICFKVFNFLGPCAGSWILSSLQLSYLIRRIPALSPIWFGVTYDVSKENVTGSSRIFNFPSYLTGL